MREPEFNTSAFPIARCKPCGRTALTYVALDDSGEEVRYCVHCDAPLTGELRWASADELEAAGYHIGSIPQRSGDGCGSGGCSSCALRKND